MMAPMKRGLRQVIGSSSSPYKMLLGMMAPMKSIF
jgi:hypothetical protein